MRIKISSKHGHCIAQLTPHGSCAWGDVQFVFEEAKESDAWVIFEGIAKPETTYCPPNKVILIIAEPPCMKVYDKWFIKQFAAIVGHSEKIRHPNIMKGELAPIGTFVLNPYDELIDMKPVTKTKGLSIICSNKTYAKGNRRRLEFCQRIKEHFGSEVDFFGRGIRPFDNKWDALRDYRYSVAIENSLIPDYLTEKFTDCLLAFSVPVYYGCPNASDYFDPGCYVNIDIDDFDSCVRTITKLLDSDTHYNSALDSVVANRHKLMTYYQQPPAYVRFVENLGDQAKSEQVTIYPEMKRSGFIRQIGRPAYNLISGVKAADRSRICLK